MKQTILYFSALCFTLSTLPSSHKHREIFALHDPQNTATLVVQDEHVRKKLDLWVQVSPKVQKKIKAFDFDDNSLTVANSFTIKYISELVCGGMQKKKYADDGKHVWSSAYHPKMRFVMLSEDNTHYTLSNFLNAQSSYNIKHLTSLSGVLQYLQKANINKAVLIVDLK